MSDYYRNAEKLFPDLVVDILEYFDINNRKLNIKQKSIGGFCNEHIKDKVSIYDPEVVWRICNKLSEIGVMASLEKAGTHWINRNYLFRDGEDFHKAKKYLKYLYNSMVYGFEYIYDVYKDNVLPLVWEKENGDISIGTCFKYLDGIATAKHCITDVKNIQIKGYKAEELEGKPIYISENEGIDLAFIHTGKIDEDAPIFFIDEGKVLQEVLVMGYPKVPSFLNFLAGEKATISSMASKRLTPTRGATVAIGKEFLSKIDAMLITARIRGGNSGGPVINSKGYLVGITYQMPDASSENGDYDDMGYGVAIPAKCLEEIYEKKGKQLSVPDNFFRDFISEE